MRPGGEIVSQTALSELQTAITAKLKGDSTLMALITGVFDFADVPAGQLMPYITLGDSTEVPDNALGQRGYEDTFTLHIWSRQKGFKQAQTILGRMNTLLDQKPLTLATQSHVSTMYEFTQSMNDPDDTSVRHMPVRYRLSTQE
jgi:hypothetical protein